MSELEFEDMHEGRSRINISYGRVGVGKIR